MVKIAGDAQHIMFNDTDKYIVSKNNGIVRKMESALMAHFDLKRPFLANYYLDIILNVKEWFSDHNST